MNRIILLLVSIMMGLHVSAQTETSELIPESPQTTKGTQEFPAIRFGFLSYDSALVAMPGYQQAQQQMAALRAAYEVELQRVENEFNTKYEDFLDGQRDFPRTILLKRQTELQELLPRTIEFKRQGLEDLQKAEQEAMAPLRERLNQAIALVATQQQLALVINTDANACPFIDPTMGIDLNAMVQKALNR